MKKTYIALLICALSSAHAGVLYTENFDAATPDTPWIDYGGWRGSDIPVIKDFDGNNRGVFPGAPSGAANIAVSFSGDYALGSQAYRLSFDVSGYFSRQFNLSLTDRNSNRIGIQFSNAANERAVFAQTLINGTPTSYTEGGFNGGTTAWPDGFDPDALYRVNIDINGTGSMVMIDGMELEANMVRIIYNATAVGMQSYTMEFALPEGFASVSGIRIAKDVRTDIERTIDNLLLTGYPAVPESSASALALAAAALGGMVFFAKVKKKRKHQ